MRLFDSMVEPRLITGIMVVVYAVISQQGMLFLLSAGSLSWVLIIAGVLMLIAGILGASSAWFGSWWLEGPSALLAVVGFMLVSINELVLATAHVRWPIYSILTTVILLLLFFARAVRVWPYSYRPGVLPKSELEVAKEQYNRTKEEYLSAIQE